MSTFRRWLADMLTFGLVRKMDEDIERERENLNRMKRGEERLALPPSKDWADTMHVDPFWRRPRKERS